MSISLDYALEHKNDPAVLCCRAEAGTVLSEHNLEDPAIFDDLVDSNLLDLTGALKDLSFVMRSVYDLPTVQERNAMDIAAERLKLDQSKAAAAAAEDGSDSDTGVVELAPVLEDDDAQT